MILGLPQMEYAGSDWVLFNSYRYMKDAKADQALITRFKTLLFQAKSGRYFLYQEVA